MIPLPTLMVLWSSVWLTAGSLTPPQLQGFPVELRKPNTSGGLISVVFEHGQAPSIVATAGESVTVVNASGAVRRGFPVVLRNAADSVTLQFQGAPAACDLDGDGIPEIVLAGSDGRLHVLRETGAMVSGFPITLPGVAKGPIACLPTGGRNDLVLTVESGQLMRISGRGGMSTVLAELGQGAESGVALGDLDGDGIQDLVAAGFDSLVAVRQNGSLLPGFPVKLQFRATAVPALGDINDDGLLDVVVGSEDYKIYAFTGQGKPLAGFPVATTYRLYAGVCLGDLNGDDVLDVAAPTGDGKLVGVDGHGATLPGFPVQLDSRLGSGCVMGDADRDGHLEIGVVSSAGAVHLIDHLGAEKPGFPWGSKGQLQTAPVFADLRNDGTLAFVVEDHAGNLQAFMLPNVGSVPTASAPWPMVGQNAAHSGKVFPNPGRFKDLGWSNAAPTVLDPLQVRYHFFDLDGDAEKNTQVRWFLGDVLQSSFNNQLEVPVAHLHKHQLWRYTLQEGQNFQTFGEAHAHSRIFRSPPIEILNTLPSAPQVALSPNEPVVGQSLHASVVQKSTDADGDPLKYRFLWLKDNKQQPLPDTSTQVAGEQVRKHQRWTLMARAYDGEGEGPAASTQVLVVNTVPTAPSIALEPNSPLAGQAVQVQIVAPGVDADQDPVTYRYRFWANGKALNLTNTEGVVAAQALRKHDALRVEVTAQDDEHMGGSRQIETRVQNTPPPAPQIKIWPAVPHVGDELTLAVTAQEADADGDTVVLRQRWFLDGVVTNHNALVPAKMVRKGQTWRLDVTPFDGEVAGASASVQTRVENTPPLPPRVALDRYTFTHEETIHPSVVLAAQDADGDAVTLHYRWSKGSGYPLVTTDALSPDATRKGDTWDLAVMGFDGQVEGPPARLTVHIGNAAPKAPVVALSNTSPKITDTVEVKIIKEAFDPDGDAVTYRLRWWRNDVLQPTLQDHHTLLAGTGHRGDHWSVAVSAFDGEAAGPPVGLDLWIENHAPMMPAVQVKPAQPRTDDPLSCVAAGPGTDPDGDPLTFITHWFMNGQPVRLAADALALPAALTFEKQAWSCSMQAFDGNLLSAPAVSAPVVIGNSPPEGAVAAINPPVPHTGDDLRCALKTPAQDADGDVITYDTSWRLAGKPFGAFGVASDGSVEGRYVHRSQVWECTLVPTDGKARGRAAVAAVTVQNTPPSPPQVALSPTTPLPGDVLKCVIVTPSKDRDGDKITYRFLWKRAGAPQPFAPVSAEVPSRLIKAADIWSCEVVAVDEAGALSTTATSQDVLIGAP